MDFKISNQSKKEGAEEMHAKHQFKHKLIKIPIAAATLFLAIAMFMQLSTPTTVYADSMTEQDTAEENTWQGTGITYSNTGWLFYLLDPITGAQVDDIRAILSYDGIIDADQPDEWVTSINLTATTGNRFTAYDTIERNAPWGPPFDSNANPRGDEVRQWLKSESNSEVGHVKAYSIIKDFWGETEAQMCEDKDLYLAFEPFYWGILFKDGSSTDVWFCGTSSMWGKTMQSLGINRSHDEYVYSDDDSMNGDPITKRYTNNIFPGCVTLDEVPENNLMGYQVPMDLGGSTRLKNVQMYSPGSTRQMTGYGLGIVWSDKESQTSTYDEPLTTPAPAPDDKEELPYIDQITEGKYANIVKFYEEHHLDTEGNLIEEDTIRAAYTRTPTPRTITIEDEEPVGYTVKEWFTSPTYRRGTLPQNVSIQHLTSF